MAMFLDDPLSGLGEVERPWLGVTAGFRGRLGGAPHPPALRDGDLSRTPGFARLGEVGWRRTPCGDGSH